MSRHKKSHKPQSFTEAMESKEQEEDGFPCRSGRFPLDALIRKAGWQIWRRRGKEEPVWIKRFEGEKKQSEVLATLDQNAVADARYEQDLLCQGFE